MIQKDPRPKKSAGTQNLLKLDYEYGVLNLGTGQTIAGTNNGNVSKQTITVPTVGANNGFIATQYYAYDSLNRIQIATENVTPNGQSAQLSWRQQFGYDRYGNRNFDEANTTTLPKECSNNTEVCAAIRPVVNPSVNAVNNRLNGYTFDAAGNTIQDAELRKFTYDAENKQAKVETVNSGGTVTGTIGQYSYDGDGKRIKKKGYTNNVLTEETIFVYDAAGKLVAEYSSEIASVNDAKVAYLTNDHLGSPRITTDQLGQVIARHDYHPFGDEIGTLNGGSPHRTTALNYTADSVRQKFTGYERDNETDLDFAQARYFAYNHGRFTSVDPLAASANPIRPQSWNRYVYSFNNPLRYTDPSGMIAGDFYNLDGEKIGTDGVDDKKIYIVYNEDKAKEIEKTKGNYTDTVDSKITIANVDVITAVGDAVTRSNNAPFSDKLGKDSKVSGGFQEAGATWTTTDGKTEITVAPNGATADPRVPGGKAEISLPSDADGKVHIHPSGQIVTTSGAGNKSDGVGMVMGGGTTTTTTANFVQKPSAVDISNASSGTNIVVGARDKTVFFYKSSGNNSDCNCVAKMSLGNFLKIGRQR